MALVLATTWGLTATKGYGVPLGFARLREAGIPTPPAIKAQYLPTPAEMLNPTRGIFAWNAEDQLALWTALEALKTDPTHYEEVILGRARRIQEKLKTRDFVWVSKGKEYLPPVQLTLPEMILSGHALSRYFCRPEEQDIDIGTKLYQYVFGGNKAEKFCDDKNAQSQRLMHQIDDWATVKGN
jgi:hypothetical protein